MKSVDIRAMTADELTSKLAELKKEQFNLRFQSATGQLENSARARQERCAATLHAAKPSRLRKPAARTLEHKDDRHAKTYIARHCGE